MNPETPDKSLFTANVIGALVIGLIAGFLIGAYYVKHTYNENGTMGNNNAMLGNASSTDASSTSPIIYSPSETSMAGHLITTDSHADVTDQAAGNTVNISSLILDRTYWVAVRDSSTEVQNPYVLGARRVQAGTYQNMVVALSRSTLAGKSYEIVLYKDNGGPFVYNPNDLVEVSNNSPILFTFKAV